MYNNKIQAKGNVTKNKSNTSIELVSIVSIIDINMSDIPWIENIKIILAFA